MNPYIWIALRFDLSRFQVQTVTGYDETCAWCLQVRLLQRSDIPLEAVDHHISNIVTVLMKDDALMDMTLALVDSPGEFLHGDPHQVLRSLMYALRSIQSRSKLCYRMSAKRSNSDVFISVYMQNAEL